MGVGMKPEKLVEIWRGGLAVLLDRAWDGFHLIPAGRRVGLSLEHSPDAYLELVEQDPDWWGES